MLNDKALAEKARKIKLAIFDLDGVLTDGTLFYTDSEMQFKGFHAHDGLGLQLLQRGGIEVGIITCHNSDVVARRMEALKIKHVYQGQREKMGAYEDLLKKLNLTDENVAYVGDDLPDLPLIKRAGLGIAVANACDFVKQHANWQSTHFGGNGAVREICEMILRAQDALASLQSEYLPQT